MKTTVYGDVLFVINFSMDLLSLFISGRVLHLKIRRRFLCLASVVGGIYGVCALFIPSNTIVIISNIAVYLLMCYVAYPSCGKKYAKLCILFYGISLLCGGAVTACYSFFDKLFSGISIPSTHSNSEKIPLWAFALIAAFCLSLSYITSKIFVKGQAVRHADIFIKIKQRGCKLRVMADSGNLLTEPLSGMPVIIITPSACKLLTGCNTEDILSKEDLIQRLRYIPATTAQGGGVLMGIVPDEIKILGGKKSTSVRAVIAIGENADFAGFDGIAPLEICE